MASPRMFSLFTHFRPRDQAMTYEAKKVYSVLIKLDVFDLNMSIYNIYYKYLIKRTLYGLLEIQILTALEDKIRIPKRPCNILYLYFWKSCKPQGWARYYVERGLEFRAYSDAYSYTM